MTLACISSAIEQTVRTPIEIIVFDNASADGSVDAIEKEFGSRVNLIRSPENLGFAGGNNAAAAQARGDYLLLLNPDTVVLDGAIDNLMDFASNRPHAAIWGGRTVFPDGSLNPASCWARQTLWSLTSQAFGLSSVFRRSSFFNPEGMGGWDRSGEREVDIVSGCFMLIRRSLWNELGGFDLNFFMYGEEADLCLRARRHGAAPRVTSSATIIHYGGASEKVRADKVVRLLKSKTLLVRRHFSRFTQPFACLLLALWPFSRSIVQRITGLFFRQKSAGSRGVFWKEVWSRRSEWLGTSASKHVEEHHA